MSAAIRAGILHVPSLNEDAGRVIATLLQELKADVLILVEQAAPSQRNLVEERLRNWCDEDELDLLITVGGSYPAPGPGSEEIVPEATLAVIERHLPGLAETMRSTAVEETAYALLDRGVCGIRGRTLIINLPAGEAASGLFLGSVIDVIEPILLHLDGAMGAPTMEEDLAESLNEGASAKGAADQTVFEEASALNADEFRAFLAKGRGDEEAD